MVKERDVIKPQTPDIEKIRCKEIIARRHYPCLLFGISCTCREAEKRAV